VQVLEVLEDPPLKKLTKKETKPMFDPYISQAQSHSQPYLDIISIELYSLYHNLMKIRIRPKVNISSSQLMLQETMQYWFNY